MLQHLLTLPLVTRIIALAGAGGLALWGILKAKAIHGALKKANDAVSEWFWKWFRRRLNLSDSKEVRRNERTYRGEFQDYWYSSTPYPTHLFKIIHDGVTTTVPVKDTGLFHGIKRGALVEVDTEVRAGYTMEFVKRLHEIKKS